MDVDCGELGAERPINTLLLTPFQRAVRVSPYEDAVGRPCAVIVKAAETAPGGTVALAGALKP